MIKNVKVTVNSSIEAWTLKDSFLFFCSTPGLISAVTQLARFCLKKRLKNDPGPLKELLQVPSTPLQCPKCDITSSCGVLLLPRHHSISPPLLLCSSCPLPQPRLYRLTNCWEVLHCFAPLASSPPPLLLLCSS